MNYHSISFLFPIIPELLKYSLIFDIIFYYIKNGEYYEYDEYDKYGGSYYINEKKTELT